MRLNYETCLSGTKCVLVPYRPEHVETYHKWMQDPYLLDTTGSEPLSLEEEMDMQRSWRDDEDKCTFIVLSRDECGRELPADGEDRPDFVRQNLVAMAGDVNLFVSEEDGDDDDSEIDVGEAALIPGSSSESDSVDRRRRGRRQGELNIMVAREDCRGRGMGTEAAVVMMLYGARNLGIRRFFAKIGEENIASRKMFEKALGFRECNYVECFREVELELVKESAQDMVAALEERLSKGIISWQCGLAPST